MDPGQPVVDADIGVRDAGEVTPALAGEGHTPIQPDNPEHGPSGFGGGAEAGFSEGEGLTDEDRFGDVTGNQQMADVTAFRNATLQGAYVIMAARSIGLDCGPMSGFDNAGLDEAFFAGTPIKSNFLINIGYGDASRDLYARSPRLSFDEACRVE